MKTAPARDANDTLAVVGGGLVLLALLALLGGAAGWLGHLLANWMGVVVAELLLLALALFAFFWIGWATDLPGKTSAVPPGEPELDATWGRRDLPAGGKGERDEQGRRRGEWAWEWRPGVPRLQLHFRAGVPDGPHRSWFDNGQKEYEGAFAADRRTGIWTQWHRNGQKAAERSFVDDRAEGESKAWWETGEPRWQLCFDAGREHGAASYWRRGGALQRKGRFENGLRHGQWTEWHDNGRLSAVQQFAAGQAEGLSVHWDRAGQLLELVNWRAGVREGEAGDWHPDGRLKSWGAYHRDARQGMWRRWHENGVPASREHYQRGSLDGEATYWYEDGCERERSHWRHGQRHGPFVQRHVNGVAALRGEYRKEKQHGNWVACDDAGQPASEVHFRLGQLHGPWRRWHPDGRPWVEAHYHRGMLHGEWAQWRPDGRLWARVHFVYGIPLERGRLRFRDPQELDRPPTNRWFLLFWLALALVGAVTVWKEYALGVGLCAVLLAIMIHEWGHYLAAWAVGIPIRTFRVGAGPVLGRLRLGNTTFELSLLPFWGYVMPYTLREGQRAYYHAARRAFRRGQPLPPESPGGTIGRQTAADGVSAPRRLLFLTGGVVFNFITAAGLLYASTFLPPPPDPFAHLYVEQERLHSEIKLVEAEQSAIKSELEALDAEKARLNRDRADLDRQHLRLVAEVRALGQQGGLSAERQRQCADALRALREVRRDEEGAWQARWQAHQRLEQDRSVKVQQHAELGRRWHELVRQHNHVVEEMPDPAEPTPRVGLEGIGRSLMQESPRGAMRNYALFNVILAVFNLFPIPPLDGYHVLAVLLRVVFRRRMSPRARNAVNLFGCLVMVLLLAASLYFMVREVLGILLRGEPGP